MQLLDYEHGYINLDLVCRVLVSTSSEITLEFNGMESILLQGDSAVTVLEYLQRVPNIVKIPDKPLTDAQRQA